ncbi:MAG: methyltransferase domain-containing protein [Spirochaetes bacterium]|nr:methyltransferase domain-containing protein [Spirochaetota bacterium]
MDTQFIEKRYSELAASECCLSCGSSLKLSNAKKGEICVDLGSGRGTDVLRLADIVGDEGFVFGIDVADEMINTAKKNALKFNAKNVCFIKSDLERIKLDNETADLVISNCTINHVNDKRSVWREIYRILKKKGRFVISDIYSLEEVPDQYKNDPAAVAECWAGTITKKEYLKILDSSGFKNINMLEESCPYEKGKIKIASFTITGSK